MLIGLLAGGLYLYANYRFGQIHKVHAEHLVAGQAQGKPFNVLLVGSDSRSFVTNARQQQAFGSPGVESGQRSDVTMVARVVPATRQVWIISIPRDLWVDIPGNTPDVSGMNRINTAFNSGPDLLIQTVEKDLGIPINHYVAVNFSGFQGMVDALGGVHMNFPTPVRDTQSGLNVTTTGCQVVDGAEALELVRSRHLYYDADGEYQYDGQSDFSRIQRQDAFFRAVLRKASTSLDNPIAINDFIGAAVDNLTIDDTFTKSSLFGLAEQFKGLPSTSLHTETLPTYGYTTDGGAEVLGAAEPYALQMIAAFNAAGTAPPRAASHSTSTTVAPTPSSTTTVPSNVVTNTQPEPWNPTPC